MAKIWVKGYVKEDGTKVPGHYREVSGTMSSRDKATMASKIRLGQPIETARRQLQMRGIQPRMLKTTAKKASRQYGRELATRGLSSFTKFLAKTF